MKMTGKKFKDMSDKELKKRAKSLYNMIYNRRCFGSNDLLRYPIIIKELRKRGYRVKTELKISK